MSLHAGFRRRPATAPSNLPPLPHIFCHFQQLEPEGVVFSIPGVRRRAPGCPDMLSRHRDGLKPHFQVSIQNSGYAPSGKDAAIFMRPNPMAVSLERDDKFGWKVRRSVYMRAIFRTSPQRRTNKLFVIAWARPSLLEKQRRHPFHAAAFTYNLDVKLRVKQQVVADSSSEM